MSGLPRETIPEKWCDELWEQPGLHLERGSCDLRELIQAAASAAPYDRIEFGPLPSVVGYWDAEQLRVLLVTLVDRACRCSSGPVLLEFSRTETMVRFSLTGSGSRLPVALPAALFVRLLEQDPAPWELVHGQRVTRAHGGRLEVESRPRSGIRFRLEIPTES